MEKTPDSNEIWMRRALALGEQVRGQTGDNPHVGCVLVHQEKIVVEGWTHPPGQEHAEAHALRQAQQLGLDCSQLTLYCTLEPCSFVGRTPACAESIQAAGISKVVMGLRDPHPRVNGKGVQILQKAGIEVVEGVCAEEIRISLQDWLAQFEA